MGRGSGHRGAPLTDEIPDQRRTARYNPGVLLRRGDVGRRMPGLFEHGSCGRLTLRQALIQQRHYVLQDLPRQQDLRGQDVVQQLRSRPLQVIQDPLDIRAKRLLRWPGWPRSPASSSLHCRARQA